MSLQKGQLVYAHTLQQRLIVQEKLGEGGQGEVYSVTDGENTYALKWYSFEQSTQEQKAAINYLVKQGGPIGIAGQRFIWPLDIITIEQITEFGYLMPLIDTNRFAALGEVQAHRKPAPSLPTLCEISYQIANSYRALHLSGYCYRDIAAGNVMFDPNSGEVLICDNDNVGINRQSKSQVWGTMEYMAPELILGKADPSIETDLYALAVLLFNIWVWHHPFHGEMEYNIYVWDIPAKRRIYGEIPVFIFDPIDNRNKLPNDPEYSTANKRWSYCPPSLQALFIRAFTDGIHNPSSRVTEGEWQELFMQLKNGSIACKKCQAENLWDKAPLNCWHCNTEIPIVPKLVLTDETSQQIVLLTNQKQIFTESQLIGQVVQNPNNPKIWGIRNLTTMEWTALFADGTQKIIEPQRAAPLKLGLKLKIGEVEAEIVA